MDVDTALFDLDGTLVQHSHVLLPDKLAEWGHPRPAHRVERAFDAQIRWFYGLATELTADGDPEPEFWAGVWREMYGRVAAELEISGSEVIHRMESFFATVPTPPLFDDVLPLLDRLDKGGLQMGIITQRGRAGAEQFLRDHGLTRRFSALVAGDDGHGRKPSPKPFRRALGLLGSRPDRAIFVGDRIDDDCGGAYRAGLQAFLIDRRSLFRNVLLEEDLEFVHLSSLVELTEHLIPPEQALANE